MEGGQRGGDIMEMTAEHQGNVKMHKFPGCFQSVSWWKFKGKCPVTGRVLIGYLLRMKCAQILLLINSRKHQRFFSDLLKSNYHTLR